MNPIKIFGEYNFDTSKIVIPKDFILPSQEEYPKGKYKLQLLFRNTSKSIDYYIDKIFLSNKSN